MRILLFGSGGRESAFAWKMVQSPLCKEVIVSPGNSGMPLIDPKISILPSMSFDYYLDLKPDLVVIGPEALLEAGIVDFFEKYKIPVVGPTKAAAQLETSKIFCKKIFTEAGIPTAQYKTASSFEEANLIIEGQHQSQWVIKVDELAGGKGVRICQSKKEAKLACEEFFDGSYLGVKAKNLVLEEKLDGPEVSAFALCDGKNFTYMGTATDYKRLLDQNMGPNTGGMGTISPSPLVSQKEEEWIKSSIFDASLKVMNEKGIPFKGFLFVGLMKTENGFFALEFNTRMGDPETQSLFPRIKNDLVSVLMQAATGEISLAELNLEKTAIHIVLAAEGYPGVSGETIIQGDEIEVGPLTHQCKFFPAGVSMKNNQLITSGGRVGGLTVIANNLVEARAVAYEEIQKIKFRGAQYRRDIGSDFL